MAAQGSLQTDTVLKLTAATAAKLPLGQKSSPARMGTLRQVPRHEAVLDGNVHK